MARTIQARFPVLAVLLTSTAPEASVRIAVARTAETSGNILDCSEREYRFRARRASPFQWTSPAIRVRLANSAAGMNVYFRIPDGPVWSILHVTLLVITLCGWFGSFLLGELLFAPWIALTVLMLSMGNVWFIGQQVLGVLEHELDAHI